MAGKTERSKASPHQLIVVDPGVPFGFRPNLDQVLEQQFEQILIDKLPFRIRGIGRGIVELRSLDLSILTRDDNVYTPAGPINPYFFQVHMNSMVPRRLANTRCLLTYDGQIFKGDNSFDKTELKNSGRARLHFWDWSPSTDQRAKPVYLPAGVDFNKVSFSIDPNNNLAVPSVDDVDEDQLATFREWNLKDYLPQDANYKPKPQNHPVLGRFEIERIYYRMNNRGELPFSYYFHTDTAHGKRRVRYGSDGLYAVENRELESPQIELEQNADPLVHLPPEFPILLIKPDMTDYEPFYKEPKRHNTQRYAWWTPQVSDTPSFIRPTEQLLESATWHEDKTFEYGYTSTEVIPSLRWAVSPPNITP